MIKLWNRTCESDLNFILPNSLSNCRIFTFKPTLTLNLIINFKPNYLSYINFIFVKLSEIGKPNKSYNTHILVKLMSRAPTVNQNG